MAQGRRKEGLGEGYAYNAVVALLTERLAPSLEAAAALERWKPTL